jgi:predicted Zn-dependent protease with MMP-like domain
VAIVQISRITARKGLQEDLPQPLAGAELGWAIDDRRLFIGNGTLEEGAPVVGNTEVLTEFSDVLNFATMYTYKGDAAGYTVQTGPTPGSPITQSLQSRMDSYAVVTDFGAMGDGLTDDTAAINRALQQLYCEQVNPAIRRSLFFPAGSYIITDTLLIPSYAKLYGEGANSSIINFNVQNWAANTAYASGVLVYYVTGGAYYRSIAEVPATGIAVTNASYWAVESLPGYIARTADSLQQTGVNIGLNGAITPRNIEISGMAFYTNQIHDGVLVQAAKECYFDNVSIAGPLTTANLTLSTDNVAAIRWDSTDSLITSHVTWNNASFSGFTYGTATAEQVQSITISNSSFDTLYQGVYLGSGSPVNGGPTGFRITANKFNNIYVQGIVMNNVSLNISAYNIFYDVGNHFNGVTLPSSSIILIDDSNNISIGDMFQRTNQYATGSYVRVELSDTNSIALGMNVSNITFYQNNAIDYTLSNQLSLGTYRRMSGISDVLTNNVSNRTLFTFDAIYARAVKIDYTIVRVSDVQTGSYLIAAGTNSSGTGLTGQDTSIDNGAGPGVTFSVSETAGVVTWKYTTSSTGNNGTIYYSVQILA